MADESSNRESRRARGARLMKDVCGVDAPPPNLGRFVDMTVEHLFGDVWSGGALSIRDRRLIVLGILGALGDLENATVHMRQALERGDLTKEELDEVVVQITHYAGWPRGTIALRAAGTAAQPPPARE